MQSIDIIAAAFTGICSCTLGAHWCLRAEQPMEAAPKAGLSDGLQWLTSPAIQEQVATQAKEKAHFAMTERDELQQAIFLALIEENEAYPSDEDEEMIAAWVEDMAENVASELRNAKLGERTGSVDPEVLSATVASPSADTEGFDNAADQAAHDVCLDERIYAAMSKLSEMDREIIRDKFFDNSNLSALSKEEGGCASKGRMRLLRAKSKFQEAFAEQAVAASDPAIDGPSPLAP